MGKFQGRVNFFGEIVFFLKKNPNYHYQIIVVLRPHSAEEEEVQQCQGRPKRRIVVKIHCRGFPAAAGTFFHLSFASRSSGGSWHCIPPPGSRRRHTALLASSLLAIFQQQETQSVGGKNILFERQEGEILSRDIDLFFILPTCPTLIYLPLGGILDRFFLPHQAFLGGWRSSAFLPYLFSSVCFAKTGPPEREFRSICNVAHNNSKFPVLYRSGGKNSLVLFSFVLDLRL